MIDVTLDRLHSQQICSSLHSRSSDYDEVKKGYECTEDVYVRGWRRGKINKFTCSREEK